jgi:hypothetical protein
MSEKTGGPAFPFTGDWEGMTLRDYFAAKAMIAILVEVGRSHGVAHTLDDKIAQQSYIVADAMLRAREVKP